MESIIWPEEYTPGFTDNYCSNEVIVAGLTVADVLAVFEQQPATGPHTTAMWPTIRFHDGSGPGTEHRRPLSLFRPSVSPLKQKLSNMCLPAHGKPARLAWHGWAEGDEETRLDVVHAWLLEDLDQGRVRVSDPGVAGSAKPAQELARTRAQSDDQWSSGLAGRTD